MSWAGCFGQGWAAWGPRLVKLAAVALGVFPRHKARRGSMRRSGQCVCRELLAASTTLAPRVEPEVDDDRGVGAWNHLVREAQEWGSVKVGDTEFCSNPRRTLRHAGCEDRAAVPVPRAYGPTSTQPGAAPRDPGGYSGRSATSGVAGPHFHGRRSDGSRGLRSGRSGGGGPGRRGGAALR